MMLEQIPEYTFPFHQMILCILFLSVVQASNQISIRRPVTSPVPIMASRSHSAEPLDISTVSSEMTRPIEDLGDDELKSIHNVLSEIQSIGSSILPGADFDDLWEAVRERVQTLPLFNGRSEIHRVLPAPR